MSQHTWIHISDLHFGYENISTNSCKKELLCYISDLAKKNKYKYLFITGDIIFGKKNGINKKNKYIEAAKYIREIAEIAGINIENIFIVPGNHDIELSPVHTSITKLAKDSYVAKNGILEQSSFSSILSHFSDYSEFYSSFLKRNFEIKHFVKTTDDLNILHINTALMCDKSSSDHGQLIIGMQLLDDALSQIQNDKPTIALAHHSFEWLRSDEREKVEIHLKKSNVQLYLCGHYHEPRTEIFNRMNHDKNILECLCSSSIESFETTPTTMGFFTGEVDFESKNGVVISHIWDTDKDKWKIDCEYQAFTPSLNITELDNVLPYTSHNLNNETFTSPEKKETISDNNEAPLGYSFSCLNNVYIKDNDISERILTKNIDAPTQQNVRTIEPTVIPKGMLKESEYVGSIYDRYPSDKTYLITGGCGSIGKEICKIILESNPERIIIIDCCESEAYNLQQEFQRNYNYDTDIKFFITSIYDFSEMERIFATYKPDYVIHSAASKFILFGDESIRHSIITNICATSNMLKLCNKYHPEKFLNISTEKVSYSDYNIGKTKLFAELLTEYYSYIDTQTVYSNIRLGNSVSKEGSIINLFQKQISLGGPIIITHPEIRRHFLSNSDAAMLICDALILSENGDNFLVDMGKSIRIVEIAENLILNNKLKPYKDIDIVFSGLRPGEKLYEELLVSESVLSTPNSRLFRIPTKSRDFRNIIRRYNNLICYLKDNNIQEVMREITFK